ncbi:hypothetical protein [Aidingimonas lacisalsi]|uniref:hypothetical protein n=1 Tax=Aidingimonas lacisalsi TaxID=2604086 RepID=UPI0011D1DB94|nr:hypothetical protein [Aidingimonas lacisalsi]
MAIPLAPALLILARSVGVALRKWPSILALTGLVAASGFTFNSMVRQAGETALSLWPLLALACFFLLAREVLKAWLKIKSKEGNVKKEER